MSTSTEMKPQMPSEMMKNAARVYTSQYKLLGYKKIANLIKTQHPEYSLSTKQLKEFFAVKENISEMSGCILLKIELSDTQKFPKFLG